MTQILLYHFKENAMFYEAKDFLETADKETLHIISNARRLTREYYFTDYDDTKTKNEILKELLGAVGKNIAIDVPFHSRKLRCCWESV